MKNIANSFYYNPKYKRSLQWFKLIAMTGAAQVLIQAFGLISGILIIRLLPTAEYAFYTLTNATLGSLTILADGGISVAVMAQGGKYWDSREKLGVVISTGLDLRRKFGIVSLLMAIPVLFYLLRHHNASLLFTILIVLSLIPAFFSALSDSLLEIGPKLKQDIPLLQKNQVTTSIARLILTTITVFIFPWTFIAILGNGLPRMWANIRLRKLSGKYVDFSQKPDYQIRKEILKVVKRSLPEIIYYSLSGQITIWLISFFGSTSSVAQVGALGRISMVLSLFGVLTGTLIVPRFARLPNKSKLLIKRFFQTNILFLVFCTAIIGVTWLFSDQLLWILGKNYSGLNTLLVLSMIAACIGLLIGVAWGLYSSRGYIINPLISIPINVTSIICGAFLFKISTTYGIYILNIFVGTIQLLMHVIYGLYKLYAVKDDSDKNAVLSF